MSMDDYCNIYCSNNPYVDAGSPGDEVKIISGRAVVHGIIAYVKGPGDIADVMNQRPMYLSGPDGNNSGVTTFGPGVFQFVFPDFADGNLVGNYPFYTGGNGILFEDGVYFGSQPYASKYGVTGFETIITLLVFFTGGALTT